MANVQFERDDIENRCPENLPRVKSEHEDKNSFAQATKRRALATLPCNGNRLPPSRVLKQEQKSTELSGKVSALCIRPQNSQTFSIYCDESDKSDTSEALSDLPPDVTSLHQSNGTAQYCCAEHTAESVALSVLSEDNNDEIYEDSAMLVDSSLEEKEEKYWFRNDKAYLSVYASDMFQYIRNVEQQFRPKPYYMRKQPDITHGMRSILVDWLVEVAEEYQLHSETLYLAVSYIDRFLSSMSVVRNKLQLVGTASMFIAAKYEEIYPPDIREFVYITDDTYNKKQVLRMEHLILKALSFDLAVPTSSYFLHLFCCVGNIPQLAKFLAEYLCELSLLEAEPYLQYLPSQVAASAVSLANHTLGREAWSETLRSFTGFILEDIEECTKSLYTSFVNAASYPQQAVRDKYKSSKFRSVSTLSPPTTLPH